MRGKIKKIKTVICSLLCIYILCSIYPIFMPTEPIDLPKAEEVGKVIFWDKGEEVCILSEKEEIDDFMDHVSLLNAAHTEPSFLYWKVAARSSDVECYVLDKNDEPLRGIWSRPGFLQVYYNGSETGSSCYVVQTFEYLILKKDPIRDYLKTKGWYGKI